MVREREIIDAQVAPAHQGPSADLKRALDTWPGFHYWVPGEGPGRVVLVRELRRPTRERWWLHVLLFGVTFVTVAAGGVLLGPYGSAPAPGTGEWYSVLLGWFRGLGPGLPFAMALMGILLAHECGHYFAARRYGINASPPYFIPAPWFLNLAVGTFGAFIRLRSPVADRRQLMDVGAAGPWAGFVISVVFLIVGLQRSELMSAPPAPVPFIVFVQGWGAVPLGDSILTYLARHWLVGDGTVQLHPLAMAGWLGLFVTTLNLLPLGQLDGGHILYALIGDLQATVGRLVWLSLIPLGTLFYGWWFWAALILLFSRGRVAHPTVLDRYRAMPASRKWLGWATIVLFVLTFAPAAIQAPIHS